VAEDKPVEVFEVRLPTCTRRVRAAWGYMNCDGVLKRVNTRLLVCTKCGAMYAEPGGAK